MSKVLKPSKATGQIMAVGGVNYKIIGRLGKGNSIVYLAKGPDGNLVSIKIITPTRNDSNWANSAFYEIAVTEFYREQGESVPRIIGYELTESSANRLKKAVLVKEYIEGITFEELAYMFHFRRSKVWSIYLEQKKQIIPEARRISEVHKKFSLWLSEKGIDLSTHDFGLLHRFYISPDSAQRNFIYSAKHGKWIFFDP